MVWIDSDIKDGDLQEKRVTKWCDGPGSLRLEIRTDGDIDDVIIKIADNDSSGIYDDIEKPDEEYHFQVKHNHIKKAVVEEASRVLKKYGLYGYNGNWMHAYEDIFPVSAVLKLLGDKSTFEEESESYYTNLKTEIELIMIIK